MNSRASDALKNQPRVIFDINSSDIRYHSVSKGESCVWFTGKNPLEMKYAFTAYLNVYMNKYGQTLFVKSNTPYSLVLTLVNPYDKHSVGQYINMFFRKLREIVEITRLHTSDYLQKMNTNAQTVPRLPTQETQKVEASVQDGDWPVDIQEIIDRHHRVKPVEKSSMEKTSNNENTPVEKSPSSTALINSQLQSTSYSMPLSEAEELSSDMDMNSGDEQSMDALQEIDESMEDLLDSIKEQSISDQCIPEELLRPRTFQW